MEIQRKLVSSGKIRVLGVWTGEGTTELVGKLVARMAMMPSQSVISHSDRLARVYLRMKYT